MCVRSWR